MSTKKAFVRASVLVGIAVLASGCGGGDAEGDRAIAASTMPSPNQQAFENVALAANGGSYTLTWNLPYSGPSVSGTNHAGSDFVGLTASPLTSGPQTSTQSARRNLAATLALPASAPSRYLKDGTVLVVPGEQQTHVATYVDDNVRVDTLASDGQTVALSQMRSDYSTVALTGTIGAAPPDLAHWYNAFWSNPLILDPAVPFVTGAAYVKYTATNVGDRYAVFDCYATTTGANVSPCASGTTLEAALTAGLTSNSDGRTYHLADGAVATVGGVPVWVATQQRPAAKTLSLTPQYRIYFQLAGNVYTGALTRDGALLTNSYWVSNPSGATALERLTFLPYQVKLNKAAHDSIAAAMRI